MGSKAVHISKNEEARSIAPLRLGDGKFSEAWLQKLVQRHPDILPVHEIEPGFGRLLPVAMEVPCSQGYIDNVFVSPDGDIVICELKLWRNPQARREVVAQVLDYISALNEMTYEAFERMCLSGQTSSEIKSLYELVADQGDGLEEAAFVDAVSRNLDRGRILALAVGDGIRSKAEKLADLLDSSVHSQFTFALVELSIYENPDGGYFIVPSTLAKTSMIPRQVFVPVSDKTVLSAATLGNAHDNGGGVNPSGSISETQFYETMAQRNPNLPTAIKRFLERLEPLGVYPEWKASLNLYREIPNGDRPLNAGYIQRNGQFYTSPASWSGRSEIGKLYHTGVAELIGGELYVSESDWFQCYATTNGKSAPRIEDLLPEHEDGLVKLIAEYIQRAVSNSS